MAAKKTKGKPPKHAPKRATPKNKVSKRARRVAIAKGLIEQQRPADIARAIGVSRKTVYEELRQPETQALIRAWLKPYHQEIRELIPLSLKAVKTSLKMCTKNAEYVDTLDALRTVRMVGHFLNWAEGKAGDGDDGSPLRRFQGTMEELLVVYRELTASDSQNSPA